jgi:hypothetical protein
MLIAVMCSAQGTVRPWGDSTSLAGLQGVFDGIGSTIDAVNDQSSEALFEPTGAGNSVASYVATITWGWSELEFGIYNMYDPSQRITIFNESTAAAGDSVVLTFDEGLGLVASIDLSNPLAPVVIDQSDYFADFGFYTIAYDGASVLEGPLYSEDSLNPGGYARFLTYEAKGDDVTLGDAGTYNDINHWYIAAEAGNYDGASTENADFNDMVVQMESITPIPEPASLVLMGGAFAMITVARRKFLI